MNAVQKDFSAQFMFRDEVESKISYSDIYDKFCESIKNVSKDPEWKNCFRLVYDYWQSNTINSTYYTKFKQIEINNVSSFTKFLSSFEVNNVIHCALIRKYDSTDEKSQYQV